MTLDKCQIDHQYKITNIDFSDEALKNRFIAFGITKGAIIKLMHHTAKKSTLSICIDQSQIALRDYEAKQIQVEVVL
ncbi:FeoA family protein [Helicobacter cappadocius]|uniref:FeoA family protein n=1 Tax=Helicobacter cappadocius TaxID=3063998 RepID=A0AA90T4M3_9HELI|nr:MULTISPECIES: FeoA family protein [unclassified Helicobacter]MDO7252611.1 FeoA family protein [Helicobacter sp. faydin-H75]MDP2538478.1 FeoA family protein [Helicobacter sp. faydin-H76]